jgi:GTPase Era involved in 16S rRNA processing
MKKWDVDDVEEDVFGESALSKIKVPINEYLDDPLKAIDLLTRVIGSVRKTYDTPKKTSFIPVKELRKEWLRQLKQIKPIELVGHLDFYRRAMLCCDRINDKALASVISGKTVLGVGGRFSAGKSSFINSVVGLGTLLPENGRPTTSIPTYITKGREKRYTLTSMGGRIRQEIDADELQVLSHEFDDRYHIGFSTFIDSCVISTPDFGISPKIVLLDTPGYSKPEDAEHGYSLSDKEMALKLLRRADRLVWLVQQENGTITADDLQFLDDIGHDRPVLIVVTHADQIGKTSMRAIIESIADMTKGLSCVVFGITGYSSPDGCEFDGGHLIKDFLKDVAETGESKNDVVGQLENLENDIEESLRNTEEMLKKRVAELKKYIAGTKKVDAMHSLAMLMATSRNKLNSVRTVLKEIAENRSRRSKLIKGITGRGYAKF